MNKELLKSNLKLGLIFIATYILFIFISFFEYSKGYGDSVISNIYSTSWVLLIVIFLSALFFFLLKHQEDKDFNKQKLKKFVWKGFFIGLLLGTILTFFTRATCYQEGCAYIIFAVPVVTIITTLLFYILGLNSLFKTNLYIVAWSIFSFVLVPIIVSTLNRNLEWVVFLMPFGFIIGTVIAILNKKINNYDQVDLK